MKEPLDPKSCGPGNHTCANPVCQRCGLDINEERQALIAYHRGKPRRKLTPMEFLECLGDLMAEYVMDQTPEEADQELLEFYGSREAVDGAVKRIREHAEHCIAEARKALNK